MGCSSAAITENGDFDPHGMVLAYLTAGAPAVVGCLWDVTDRDCDRFSVECGERWGLWRTTEDGKTVKDPRKKRRGKTAKEEVENGRDATASSQGRSGKFDVGMTDVAGASDDLQGNSLSSGTREVSLAEAVAASREACYLKYLNGAAMVMYGIPVYLYTH